jgi:hypothetical protein
MIDHYKDFSHPVLNLAPEATANLFDEMDPIADELSEHPEHIADDDQIAFRQVQKLPLPNLSTQQFLDSLRGMELAPPSATSGEGGGGRCAPGRALGAAPDAVCRARGFAAAGARRCRRAHRGRRAGDGKAHAAPRRAVAVGKVG